MVLERRGTECHIALNQVLLKTHATSSGCSIPLSRRNIGPNVLAVVLTGMGQDGMRGCEMVRRVGGRTIVQDEATSIVWGMPGSVAQAG